MNEISSISLQNCWSGSYQGVHCSLYILATLFDHGNKYNTIMLIPWLHIKPGEWEFMTTQMSIQVTWGLSVVVMVVDRVPSLPGVIVPVQVTVRPPKVDQVLKQTHAYRWENNKIYRAFPVFSAWYWGPSSERRAVYSAAGMIC